MDRIRDLTGTDGRSDDLVTGASGGLFDTQYLSGDPPAASLEPYEQPQYVLRNKSSGVERTGEGSETAVRPDGDHQALAVVTDCRVRFFIGHAGGDRVESADHDEIVEARAEKSGLVTSTLLVERVDGRRLRFPCRGDVSAVAAYVDDAAQTWTTASRLVDEAGDRLDASRDSLEEGEFADARAVLADVADDVTAARDHVATLGDGAETALESRASTLVDRLHRLEGEIAAMTGASHHAAAQDAWKDDHDFERAASEYGRGAAEYERALASSGETPPEETLRRRLRGLRGERAVLRAAPMADARAAREVAMATGDPDEAAAEWETALTCYREAATLDWGEHDRGFVIERELARERASEAATKALDAHVEAGETWVTAGDKIVKNGRRREAGQAYERAEAHLDAARDIARELQPSRLEDIDGRARALRKRKSGEVVPSVDPDEAPLSVEAVADELASDGTPARSVTAATETAGASDGEGEPPDTEPTAATRTPSDRIDESVDHTPAVRRRPTASGTHTSADATGVTAEGEAATETSPPSTRQPPVTERKTRIEPRNRQETPTSGLEQDDAGTGDPIADVGQGSPPESGEATPEGVPSTDLLAAVRRLDGRGLTELIADLWEANGWSTTVFSARTQTVYDVLAIRTRDGADERLLLWTAHRPDGGAVDETAVRRCATTRDSSRGADGATLVTTGTLTAAARRRAADLDVGVVEREALLEAVVAAGLSERLPE